MFLFLHSGCCPTWTIPASSCSVQIAICSLFSLPCPVSTLVLSFACHLIVSISFVLVLDYFAYLYLLMSLFLCEVSLMLSHISKPCVLALFHSSMCIIDSMILGLTIIKNTLILHTCILPINPTDNTLPSLTRSLPPSSSYSVYSNNVFSLSNTASLSLCLCSIFFSGSTILYWHKCAITLLPKQISRVIISG